MLGWCWGTAPQAEAPERVGGMDRDIQEQWGLRAGGGVRKPLGCEGGRREVEAGAVGWGQMTKILSDEDSVGLEGGGGIQERRGHLPLQRLLNLRVKSPNIKARPCRMQGGSTYRNTWVGDAMQHRTRRGKPQAHLT